MAITLPYPSLVFVPLDKLTAEEMNEIVTNYETIANSTNKSFFSDISDTNTRTISSSSQTRVVLSSVDISSLPTGTDFLAVAQVHGRPTSYPTVCWFQLEYNGQYNISDLLTTQSTDQPDVPGTLTLVYRQTKISGVNSVDLATGIHTGTTYVDRTYMYVQSVS